MLYDCSSSKGTEESSSEANIVRRRSPRKHLGTTEYKKAEKKNLHKNGKIDYAEPEDSDSEPEYDNSIFCNNNFTL